MEWSDKARTKTIVLTYVLIQDICRETEVFTKNPIAYMVTQFTNRCDPDPEVLSEGNNCGDFCSQIHKVHDKKKIISSCPSCF